MNGLSMMILAVVVLGGAYLIYGRYLVKKWESQKILHFSISFFLCLTIYHFILKKSTDCL